MKREMAIILLVLVCILALAGCQCEHEWVEANCTTAKTCSLCGETEGAPVGHVWAPADCVTAKTCTACGETEGEALGHSWTDATCEAPKTCENCGLTEGEALGHSWADATTEAPKTCANCGKTEGERIVTDARFTTPACAPLFGSWELTMDMDAGELDMEGLADKIPVVFTFDFGNAGDLRINMQFADLDGLMAGIIDTTVEQTYVEMEAGEISREDADAAFQATYGMTIPEYVASIYAAVDWNQMLEAFSLSYVYYVDGDQLYMDDNWDSDFDEPSTFVVNGDVLTIDDSTESQDLKRVG